MRRAGIGIGRRERERSTWEMCAGNGRGVVLDVTRAR